MYIEKYVPAAKIALILTSETTRLILPIFNANKTISKCFVATF